MTTSFSLYTMFRFGYDAHHNGYLFAYVGLIAVIIQGVLIGRLVKRFGELWLVIVGALFFAVSLFAVPFVGPNAGGLVALLIGGGIFSLGNSLSTPALNTWRRKVWAAEQGRAGSDTVSSKFGAGGRSFDCSPLDSQHLPKLGADGIVHYERPLAFHYLLDRLSDHASGLSPGSLFPASPRPSIRVGCCCGCLEHTRRFPGPAALALRLISSHIPVIPLATRE